MKKDPAELVPVMRFCCHCHCGCVELFFDAQAPDEQRVVITDDTVPLYFSKIFLSQVDISRQSLAEYVQAVPMGSPDNTLGNDPDRTADSHRERARVGGDDLAERRVRERRGLAEQARHEVTLEHRECAHRTHRPHSSRRFTQSGLVGRRAADARAL